MEVLDEWFVWFGGVSDWVRVRIKRSGGCHKFGSASGWVCAGITRSGGYHKFGGT